MGSKESEDRSQEHRRINGWGFRKANRLVRRGACAKGPRILPPDFCLPTPFLQLLEKLVEGAAGVFGIARRGR
jgi:hypothetical protein